MNKTSKNLDFDVKVSWKIDSTYNLLKEPCADPVYFRKFYNVHLFKTFDFSREGKGPDPPNTPPSSRSAPEYILHP